VTFTSLLTPKDHARVMRALAVRNPVNWVLLAWGPLFGIGWLLTGAAVAQRWCLLGFGALAIGVLGQWLIQSYLAYSPATRELYEPLAVTMKDEGVRLTGEGYDNLAAWDDFASWRRIGPVVLLYRHPRGYVALLPEHLTADGAAGLASLLADRLGRERTV
jgi:hypothetical protein